MLSDTARLHKDEDAAQGLDMAPLKSSRYRSSIRSPPTPCSCRPVRARKLEGKTSNPPARVFFALPPDLQGPGGILPGMPPVVSGGTRITRKVPTAPAWVPAGAPLREPKSAGTSPSSSREGLPRWAAVWRARAIGAVAVSRVLPGVLRPRGVRRSARM